jgi:peptidylprolyl isomerase
MKKLALLLIIPAMAILLIGCWKQWNNETLWQWNILSSTSWTMCANAIKDYLAKADTKGKAGKKVEKGHQIVVHYIGRLDEETVFDTSIEEIAKACGKYNSGRNYNEGLAFQAGAGQMIAGFDKAVEWMQIGQTKTIHIEASEAYGERSEKNLIKVPKAQIPDSDKLEKWMKVYASNGQPFSVYEITDKEVTLDANHELAGKKLIFDITVTDIK